MSTIQIRKTSIKIGVNRYAEGSALIEMGNTHVLCTASVEDSVPPWLVGKGKGWISAEYSMLPRATHTRSKRDREKVSGRTQEIQRLIGRALRGMVDLKALGERSILIDCDVLQADGGTRTASVNGGCVALAMALSRLIDAGNIERKVLIDTVGAISVGLKAGELFVDLDYEKDSTCDVDMNLVMTGQGHFVEVQGTAEKKAFTQDQLTEMTRAGAIAISEVRHLQLVALEPFGWKKRESP